MNIIYLEYNPILNYYYLGEGPKKRCIEDDLKEEEIIPRIKEVVNPKRKTHLYLHNIPEHLLSELKSTYKKTKIEIKNNS